EETMSPRCQLILHLYRNCHGMNPTPILMTVGFRTAKPVMALWCTVMKSGTTNWILRR
ncbi:hypothetical protein ETB97_012464, partial [Aspergillus alliaceus]